MAQITTRFDEHVDLLAKGIESMYEDAIFSRLKTALDQEYAKSLIDAKEMAKAAAKGAVKRVETMMNVGSRFGDTQVMVMFSGDTEGANGK